MAPAIPLGSPNVADEKLWQFEAELAAHPEAGDLIQTIEANYNR